MSSIQLTFINESNDQNNSNIVIFQKNKNGNNSNHVTAWHVIQNIGKGWNHTINYSEHVEIVARDTWKNYTTRRKAEPGESFEVVRMSSGDELQYSRQSTVGPSDIQFRNKLDSEPMDALIYRNGKLLAEVNGVEPGESAGFKFESSIYIGIVSQIKEGDCIDSAIVKSITTKLPLKGIKSGNIIMTGGGSGKDSKPLSFKLVTNSLTR